MYKRQGQAAQIRCKPAICGMDDVPLQTTARYINAISQNSICHAISIKRGQCVVEPSYISQTGRITPLIFDRRRPVLGGNAGVGMAVNGC